MYTTVAQRSSSRGPQSKTALLTNLRHGWILRTGNAVLEQIEELFLRCGTRVVGARMLNENWNGLASKNETLTVLKDPKLRYARFYGRFLTTMIFRTV